MFGIPRTRTYAHCRLTMGYLQNNFIYFELALSYWYQSTDSGIVVIMHIKENNPTMISNPNPKVTNDQKEISAQIS